MCTRSLAVCCLVFAACPSTDDTYGAAATGHPHVSTGTVVAATSGNGSTSGAIGGSTSGVSTSGTNSGAGTSGGTSVGGSSGGSSGLLSCNGVFTDCDAGMVELLTQAIDVVSQKPIPQSISIYNLDNPSFSATSGSDALVAVCTMPGTQIAPELDVSGYVQTIFNDIALQTSDCLRYVPLLQIPYWGAITSQIDDYNNAQGAVIISVVTKNNDSGGCDQSGWTFQLLPVDAGIDAGPLPTAVKYLTGTEISPQATATTPAGAAILYNIPLAAPQVWVVGTYDGGEPGKVPCSQLVGASEYTGSIHVAGNGVTSSFSFVIVDAG